jgi:hypothetical protein
VGDSSDTGNKPIAGITAAQDAKAYGEAVSDGALFAF